ncbi:MAG: TetR/AcrR family transcriptional regulator [Actinomycetota bacterium]
MADPKSSRRERTAAKREQILDTAMRRFSEHGYLGTKVESIADDLGIAKGSIFQHFGSKSGLFFETYKRAVTSLPAWLDAPPKVIEDGFFAIVDYWLRRTEHLVREDYVPYRVVLIGEFGTDDLTLKRDILRFMVSEDPYGTLDFVEYGIRRGEVRDDIDMELIVSMVDWMSGGLQDALVTEERDPGLFHRWRHQPERQKIRIEQFEILLRSAIGTAAVREAAAPETAAAN